MTTLAKMHALIPEIPELKNPLSDESQPQSKEILTFSWKEFKDKVDTTLSALVDKKTQYLHGLLENIEHDLKNIFLVEEENSGTIQRKLKKLKKHFIRRIQRNLESNPAKLSGSRAFARDDAEE